MLTLAVAACGRSVIDGAGGHAGIAGQSASPSGTGAGEGWTECSTPEGFMICGGDSECAPELCLVNIRCLCTDPTCPQPDRVRICFNDAFAKFGLRDCYGCADGNVCAQWSPPGSESWHCVPFNVGVLFASAGAADQVRYADYGLWTGEPLPLPASCPNMDGFTLCGGSCDPCPADMHCTGRSPLHPYSLCIPESAKGCGTDGPACDAGYGCFVYLVEPQAQPVADDNGYCLPAAQCQAIAQNLPGGGKCMFP